jgi:GWxTD domain-containing protein
MKILMRTTLIFVMAAFLTAGVAEAQLSAEYKNWADGPVRHLMTAEEKTEWKNVRSDAEAEAFIALFWARRDPTPATPENEWRDEFEVRVALADQHFSLRRQPGSLSDRGRVLILLGTPFNVDSRAAGGRAAGMSVTGPGGALPGDVASPRPTAARLTWNYSGDRKPAFIDRNEFEMVFQDEAGRGDFQLAKTERLNPETILEQALEYYIFNPGLTELPVYGAVPAAVASFQDPSLRKAWEEFRAADQAEIGSALLTWDEFVTPEGESFAAVQIFMPAGSGAAAGSDVTFVGVIENESGEILQVHEEPATLTATVRDSFVDESFRLEPGSYKATFGIAENGQVLAMKTTDLTIEGLDPNETGISDLILSNHLYPLTEGQFAWDPYAFGGVKVVPKGDALFATSDELWYFFELRNPGLTPQGAPKMMVRIGMEGEVSGNDEPVRLELPPGEVETFAFKGIENRYGLGMSIPLADFRPGSYTMKLRVTDMVLRKHYDFERQFEIR